MDVYAARQPIFNRKSELFGYELLYRADATSSEFDGTESSQATLEMLSNSLLSIGWENVGDGKKVLVNFDRNLLLAGIASVLPPENLIIELLESVGPDAEVVAACKDLSERGYSIALDDFVADPSFDPLIPFANLIKVDIRVTGKEAQEHLLRTYQKNGRQLVAEKVETQEEFQSALAAGYDLFQGFFFARPTTVHGHQVPMAKVACMRMLSEMQKQELDFHQLEKVIREDVSFPYRLLKYVNSSLFHFRAEIRSIDHALVVLGEQNVRHWIALAALPLLAQNKPAELVIHSLVRARFCENLADAIQFPESTRAFLLGLFSHLDALLDLPLSEALNQANIGPSIRAVLLETAAEDEAFTLLYHLVRSYEQGDWPTVRDLASKLGLVGRAISEAYAESTLWTHRALQATQRRGNTRREVRHAMNVGVRVLWESDSQREKFCNARLLNISRFGMQLLVEEKIPVRAALSCSEPTLGISGRGSVRYSIFSKGKYLVGVEFSNGTGWRDPLAS